VGIAVGLAFVILATHITALGIATSINDSPTLDVNPPRGTLVARSGLP
jgi:hypothetical protein